MVIPLSMPREVHVLAGDDGDPRCIGVRPKGRWIKVARIRNIWRIDDEWWRDEIARQYFELELDDCSVTTVFHDLVSGTWYRQRYHSVIASPDEIVAKQSVSPLSPDGKGN